MFIDILSLFEEYFKGPFDVSMIKNAREKGLLTINHRNIRDFSDDKHARVDDRPFGGGPGMVMQPKPVAKAIRSVKKEGSRVIYLSPQGKKLSAKKCERLAKEKHLILLCGHYEGIDERVIQKEVDEVISIGDFVLTNGCLASIVLIDAVARFIPGVIGHPEAAYLETHQGHHFDGPCYTRPVEFEGEMVPEVLLNGNHQEIARWREEEGLKKMKKVRPDMYANHLIEKIMKKKPDLAKSIN